MADYLIRGLDPETREELRQLLKVEAAKRNVPTGALAAALILERLHWIAEHPRADSSATS